MKFLKKVLLINLIIIIVFLAIFIIFIITPFGRPFGKALLLMPEIIPGAKVHPINLISKSPLLEQVEINSGKKKITTYIYRPDDFKKHPVIILTIPGGVPEKDVVVSYAKGFARAGFVVVVGDIPEIAIADKININRKQADDLVGIFQFLETNEHVDAGRIGYFGLCLGGSLSLLAAEDSQISSQVKFVITVSSAYDIQTIFEQIYTKSITENNSLRFWQPNQNTVLTTNR